MIPLLALMTLSSPILDINEPLFVTLTLPEPTENISDLRGKLLENGDFILLQESQHQNTYTWKLEALRPGTFFLSFYKVGTLFLPIERVTVKPFTPPDKLPVPNFLPMTPEIPPTLSAANKRLLAAIEQKQPSRNVELNQTKTFPWIPLLAGLFFVSLAPVLLWVIERKKSLKPPPTPEEEALEELQHIKEDHNSESLVVGLTQTLRYFIQKKYGLQAPTQTTEEFLIKAAKHPLLQGEQGQKLTLFLLAADQVKFAGRTPAPHEIASALAYAQSFIEKN